MDIFPVLLQEVNEDTIDRTSTASCFGKPKAPNSGSKTLSPGKVNNTLIKFDFTASLVVND